MTDSVLRCSDCGEWKPRNDFAKAKKRVFSMCNQCVEREVVASGHAFNRKTRRALRFKLGKR